MATTLASRISFGDLESLRSLLDERVVFDRVLWLLDRPAAVAAGVVSPDEFMRLVRAAFIAVPDRASYEALHELVAAVAEREALAAPADRPWAIIDDRIGRVFSDWTWAAA